MRKGYDLLVLVDRKNRVFKAMYISTVKTRKFRRVKKENAKKEDNQTMGKDRGSLGFILETMDDAKTSEIRDTYNSLPERVRIAYEDAAENLTKWESGLALYSIQVILDVQTPRTIAREQIGLAQRKKKRI